MERALEGTAEVNAGAERVIRLLSSNPADILAGMPSPEPEAFVAEMAVELAGGTSLVQEVDVTFGRRPDNGGTGSFSLSWRARDHQADFPVFEGALEIHPDGQGSQLRLSGHYSVPLGAVGAFGDRLLGHRVARRSVQNFLEAAATRIEAKLSEEAEPSPSMVPPSTSDVTVTIDEVHPELYLG